MAKDDKRVAVYIPFATLLTAIETLEQGLPARLHKSVWSSLSGGVQAQVLSAFKFLRLIDEQGKVQPTLKRLVEERENRNDVLMEVIADAYPAVIELADKNASQKDFEDAMRQYGVQGTTLDKAVRFYLQAAETVGLLTSPHWKKTKAVRTGGAKKPSKKGKRAAIKRGGTSGGDIQKNGQRASDTISVDLKSGGTVTLDVTAAFTQLEPDDREFVLALIDKMRGYKNA